MLLWSYIEWWYGLGWRDAASRISRRIRRIYLDFSVPILLSTLASPWRRLGSTGGDNLGDRVRGMIDNAVSRFIGLAVRLLALAAAGILMGLTALFGGLLVVLWPIIPGLGLALIVWGLLP
jgi:hypothetical protein